MIIAKINDVAFLDTVENARLIAFQRLEYGYAVAAPLVAFYAPISHPGGGNLPEEFWARLAEACVVRMSDPFARTLRPTAKPSPTLALTQYLHSTFGGPELSEAFKQAPGDRPEIVESECQVVIQAIEEHSRPDLREAMKPAKRDAMAEALDLVIHHAEAAREYCETGDDKPALVKLHIMQSTTAMKTCLEMLLKP